MQALTWVEASVPVPGVKRTDVGHHGRRLASGRGRLVRTRRIILSAVGSWQQRPQRGLADERQGPIQNGAIVADQGIECAHDRIEDLHDFHARVDVVLARDGREVGSKDDHALECARAHLGVYGGHLEQCREVDGVN